MHPLVIRLLLVSTTVTIATSPVRAQQVAIAPPPVLDSLRPHIRHLLDSTHAPSLSVAVAQHGKIIWEEGFGWADIAHRSPVPSIVASQIENVLLPGRATALIADRAAQQGRPREAFAAPADLVGEWTSTVRMYEGRLPITVRVKADEVLVRLGGSEALWTLLNRPAYGNELLSGQFVGTIPTADAMRHPHNAALSLWYSDGTLRGWVAAIATNRPVAGAVSSYAELTKQPTVPKE